MFTGLVEAVGTVSALSGAAGGRRLVVATDLPVERLPLGASIAVDGVCLTVVERAVGRFAADLGPETLARTTLGDLAVGARVHLERPLQVGDALGGHMVAGHVDGVGTVAASKRAGDAHELEIDVPAELSRYLVPKGSIAVDGVSLTVNWVNGDRFGVSLVPHTIAVTNLAARAAGARVNLEADLIAKQVDRLVEHYLTTRGAARP